MSGEIIQTYLGVRPYVLVEVHPDPEAPQGFDLKLRSGAGIDSPDEIVAMLLLVVETLTGVPSDDYAALIDGSKIPADGEAL